MREVSVQLFKYDELSEKAKAKARDWYREASASDSSMLGNVIAQFQEYAEMMGFTFKTHEVSLYGGGKRQDPNIWWSLGYSQSDGACFEGTWRLADVNIEKIRAEWPRTDHSINAAINQDADAIEGIINMLKTANVAQGRINVESNSSYFSVSVDSAELLNAEGQEIQDAACDVYDSSGTPNDKTVLVAASMLYNTFDESMRTLVKSMSRHLYNSLRDENDYQNQDEQVVDAIEANEYEFYESGERASRHD